MVVSLSGIRSQAISRFEALLTGHLQNWKTAWISAFSEPHLEPRVSGLIVGILTTWVLIPAAFNDLGLMSGLSYSFALYLAFANATLFRIARVGRDVYVPLGFVAPVFILVGVTGSSAMRPLIGDAKDAAMAQDFIGAAVILCVFVIVSLWFRQLRSGNPY